VRNSPDLSTILSGSALTRLPVLTEKEVDAELLPWRPHFCEGRDRIRKDMTCCCPQQVCVPGPTSAQVTARDIRAVGTNTLQKPQADSMFCLRPDTSIYCRSKERQARRCLTSAGETLSEEKCPASCCCSYDLSGQLWHSPDFSSASLLMLPSFSCKAN
jgi:hypothetical protein